jgi:hypothetical protein
VRDEPENCSDGDVPVDGGRSIVGGGVKRVVEVHRVDLVRDGVVRLVRVEGLDGHALFLRSRSWRWS